MSTKPVRLEKEAYSFEKMEAIAYRKAYIHILVLFQARSGSTHIFTNNKSNIIKASAHNIRQMQ